MTTPHEILHQRAITLATPFKLEINKDELTLLEFKIGIERYGLDIHFAKEVFLFSEITELPNTPDFVLGIMNIRRRVVPVIDLKKILKVPGDIHSTGSVVVIEKKGFEFAFLVDEVIGSISINKESITSTPCTFAGLQKDLLLGLTNEKLIILNGDILFSREEFVVQKKTGTNL